MFTFTSGWRNESIELNLLSGPITECVHMHCFMMFGKQKIVTLQKHIALSRTLPVLTTCFQYSSYILASSIQKWGLICNFGDILLIFWWQIQAQVFPQWIIQAFNDGILSFFSPQCNLNVTQRVSSTPLHKCFQLPWLIKQKRPSQANWVTSTHLMYTQRLKAVLDLTSQGFFPLLWKPCCFMDKSC